MTIENQKSKIKNPLTIRVRLFAQMSQQAGQSDFILELPSAAPLSAVRPLIEIKFSSLHWPPGTMLAVNQQYVDDTHILHQNDEVAIIPPVSGG